MEPYYFKSGDDDLFGAYHPANDMMSRKSAIICSPIFQEYHRTYRMFSNMADRWSQKGYHVLRFDYYGTGDSSGDLQHAGPARWVSDISAAMKELSEISGADQVSMLGIRYGALLAAAAVEELENVESMIMWDPIWLGDEYLRQMELSQAHYVDSQKILSASEAESAKSEICGFERCAWFDDEFRFTELSSTSVHTLEHIDIVLTQSPHPAQSTFTNNCMSAGVTVESIELDVECDWDSRSGNALQVPDVVARIEECLV